MAEIETPTVVPTEAPVAPVTVEAPVVAQTVETSPVASPEASTPLVAPDKPVTVLAEALDTPQPDKPAPVDPKTEVKTVEPPKPASEDAVEKTEGQSDEPAPPPVYDTFTVPEGVTLDTERVEKFTAILSDLELTGKVPHEFAQQFGQKAVDFHVQEVQRVADDVAKLYQTTWERQKTEWKDTFLKDPEIGGNRFQTTVDAARNFIRTHGGTPEQQTEFRNVMETSGLGNHPAIIRLLSRAGMAMEEGRPLAATKPVSAPKSKVNTLYGGGSSN